MSEVRTSEIGKDLRKWFSAMFTFVFFSLSFLVLYEKESEVIDLRDIDSTMVVEALDNIVSRGYPYSMANKAVRDAVPTFWTQGHEFCTEKFESFGGKLEKNIFNNHSYYIAYLFTPLTVFIDSKLVASGIHVGAFVAFLFITFFVARRFGVNSFAVWPLVVLILVHPNWSEGIQGQYYFDRLFLPLGLLLAYFAFVLRDKPFNKRGLLLLCIVVFLTCSIMERAALITGFFLVSIICVYWNAYEPITRKIMLFVGVFSLVYAALITLSFESDAMKSNQGKYIDVIYDLFTTKPYFMNPALGVHAGVFLVINGLLAIFALWSPRLLLIAFFIMLPNILIWDPGAATKSVWVTHYHSLYFPFLTFAAIHGYSIISKSIAGRRVAILAASSIAILLACTQPYAQGFGVSGAAYKRNAVYAALNYRAIPENPSKVFLSYRRQIESYIPAGSKVAGPESVFMSLHKDRIMTFFPIGISNADYVILTPHPEPKKGRIYSAGINFLGLEEKDIMERCLQYRLEKQGFDIENPFEVGYYRILSRK